MKQILQNLKNGNTEVADVPAPQVGRGEILIRTRRTLISAGTERMLVDFGKANLIDKARQQPDKVRMVLDKIRTDGLLPTLAAVQNKLDQPLPMGYCNAGEVIAVGEGVQGFAVGDRVASNGKHAEIVAVPANLCASVPADVGDDAAAFVVIAAIALQGIRLAQPTLGESVVVTGLGLIGLITVQLLRAQGCRVLGIDVDAQRLALARSYGAQTVDLRSGIDVVETAVSFSRGRGIDAVIVTASTDSSEPIRQAAQMCRKRGRIVLVGVTGLELSRADFYEKELSFQVSCSYGPGRYDPSYEARGNDYPIGFVRWTVQRNFEAVLDMLADRRLDVSTLISHRFDIGQAAQAYEIVGSSAPSLGIVLAFSDAQERAAPVARTVALAARRESAANVPSISVIGAGQYAGAVLLQAFTGAGARLRMIASAGGVTCTHQGRKFGFEAATTDTDSLLSDRDTDAVVICTRHDTHADYVIRALGAGKHVFVEKPLALTMAELERIQAAGDAAGGRLLMVGFNRRFAPQVERMKSLLASAPGPKAVVVTVNAGAIPEDHWTQDPRVGGGRLVGEGCHFLDLLRFLVGAPFSGFEVTGMEGKTADTVSASFRFGDGSIGTLHYLANGNRAFPKERVEVFAGGRILQLDNFRRLSGHGWSGFRKMNLWRQDKGQSACVAAFVRAVREGSAAPIPLDELIEVSQVSIRLQAALQ